METCLFNLQIKKSQDKNSYLKSYQMKERKNEKMVIKKKKIKEIFHKSAGIFLSLLMVFTCVNLSGIQSVHADSLYPEATMTYSGDTGIAVDLSSSGINKTGYVYNMKLDGTQAFCLDAGYHARKGQYARISSKSGTLYNRIWNYYNDKGWSDVNIVKAQSLFWTLEEYDSSLFAINGPLVMMTVLTTTGHTDIFGGLGNLGPATDECNEILSYSSAGTLYIYSYGLSDNQRLISSESGGIPDANYYDVTSTKSYSAPDKVVLNINKTDVEEGTTLQGIKFDVYKDGTKAATVTTNSSGKATYTFSTTYTKSATATKTYCDTYDDLSLLNQKRISVDYVTKAAAQQAADAEALSKAKAAVQALLDTKHTYKIVEVGTRNGYWINPSNNSKTTSYASGDGSGSVTFNMTNKREVGIVATTKSDSETEKTVAGAVYGLYAKANITHPDGKTGTVYKKDELVATFPATDSNGATKLTKDKNGNDLYLGQYYIKEIHAAEGYVLNEETYDVTLSYAGDSVQTVTNENGKNVSDTAQRVNIHFEKVDKLLDNGTDDASVTDSNNDGAQGDATRSGAVYGLFVSENVSHPDKKTGTVTYNSKADDKNEIALEKGTDLTVLDVEATTSNGAVYNGKTYNGLIAYATTDANGEIQFNHLYNGKYYIQELTPSEGYLLDTSKYEVDGSWTQANESKEVLELTVKDDKVYETVKKQAFELYKLGINSNKSGVADPLKGAKFTVKLESDVQRLGWDNAPAYDVLTTDDEGYALSVELPYGYYRVRETYTPKDYETANDFFITVSDDSRNPQSFTNSSIVDHEYEAMLKIVKKDAETGKTVLLSNTTFKVKALTDVTVDGKDFKAGEYIGYWNWNILDGFYTDTWKTNDEGFVLLNEKLGVGTYQIEELKAPYGYTLNSNPVGFKITTDVFHEIGKDEVTQVIPVTVSNVSVKGKITVEKRGEVLTGYNADTQQFIYEERGLANAEYGIYADEDILDPSNDGTVLYAKDTLVTTITTNNEGLATTKELPLGNYYSKELKAPKGYVLSSEIKHFSLEYIDDSAEHAIVYDSDTYVNERQKVELDISKIDIETKVPVKGAGFTIYANKNVINADGEIIVKKGEAVATAVSDSSGRIIFNIDLPIDFDDGDGYEPLFTISETTRPSGYTTYKETHDIDTVYQGQDVDNIEIAYVIENTPITVEISKTDIVTGEPVEGAELSVYTSKDGKADGEALYTWTTGADDNPHTIKRIEPGKYILREVLADAKDLGYVTANDVEFEVLDTGEIQKVEMKDDFTKLEISKTDIATSDPVEGAELSIIPVKEDGTLDLGAKFDTWITGSKPHYIERIPVGKYVLREVLGQAQELGYVTANDVEFEVLDTGEIQKVEMKDDFTKLEISKTDIVTGNSVPGAELSIIPVNEDGTLDEGAKFATWITTDEPYYIERLPIGKYVLREVLGQAQELGYVTANDVEFEVLDTGEIQKVEMKDDFTHVEFTKVDTSGNAVEGATLAIVPIDEEGNLLLGETFETWITKVDDPATETDESVHTIEYLPIGQYKLVELSAPDGYVKAESVAVDVKDTAEVQSWTMINKQVTITKTDLVDGTPVPGAELTLTDKETGEVVDKTTTDGDVWNPSNLEEGKTYILTEVTAPLGYDVAEEIEFTVTGIDENGIKVDQKIEMKDAPILTDIQVNKVDSQTGKAITSKDFEFTIYADADCTHELETVHANTKDATATFKDYRYGTYYVKETKAPEGYQLSSEVKKVLINDNTKGVGDVYSFEYQNTLMPVTIVKTDDNAMTGLFAALGLASAFGIVLSRKKKKEKDLKTEIHI